MHPEKKLRMRILLFIVIVLSALNVKAQYLDSLRVDSLVGLLMNDERTIEKVQVYRQLSFEHLNVDHNASLNYSEKGLKLAEELDYTAGVFNSKVDLGRLYMNYNLDLDKALGYFVDAEKLVDQVEVLDQINLYRGMSGVYFSMKNYDKAKFYNEKSQELAEPLGEYQRVSDLKAYMGSLYEEIGDTATALTYYAEVLDLETENNFSETTNASLISVAHYYFLIDDVDNSLKYYRIALTKFERMMDQRWTAYTHSEMARIFVLINDVDRAQKHAERGLKIAKEFSLQKEIGDNYKALAFIGEQIGDSDQAKTYNKLYQELQDSLSGLQFNPVLPELNEEENVSENSDDKACLCNNRWVQTGIILIPVLLLILMMGRPRKSK